MEGKIRIAIAGVGNCASSLVQGIHYYSGKTQNEVIGLMHHNFGGYLPEDIEVVAAFDIDRRKVGYDLAQAIYAPPNCTKNIVPEVPITGVTVKMGPILDGFSEHMRDYPEEYTFVPSDQEPCDVAEELRAAGVDVLVNYLPVGSQEAVEYYTNAALEAKVGYVNNMPVFIASDPAWAMRFAEAGLPVVGDDIKSQLGATIVHRVLAKLFEDRGVEFDRTYQLNTGGNTDFLNMLNRTRLISKKISKTKSVQSQLGVPLPSHDIHIGPSDYVPWQKDNKICFIRMEGRTFGNIPINLELRLSVEDSPNSAGVSIDAIRGAKLALDRGLVGPVYGVSAYLMKHPPVQHPDHVARELVERFIAGEENPGGTQAGSFPRQVAEVAD